MIFDSTLARQQLLALGAEGSKLISIMMTEKQATEWVYDQDESADVDQDQLEAAFAALVGREPDDDDRAAGIWSLCCSMTPNCGTRP
jgi:hypothetical protein